MKATLFRLYSDIHLDFYTHRNGYTSVDQVWTPDVQADEDQTILVIAGDLWRDNKAFHKPPLSDETWIERIAKRFHSIVFVLGNHDFWGLATETVFTKTRAGIAHLPNVHLLEKSSVVIDDFKFVGGVLWTDYNRGDPLSMLRGQNGINDFRYIRYGALDGYHRKLRPSDLAGDHWKCKEYIFQNVKRDHPQQAVVVVTHMAPDLQSISPMYKNDYQLNGSYASDLTREIEEFGKDIDIWCHGHIHQPVRYQTASDVIVVSNPKGYQGHDYFVDYQPDGIRIAIDSTWFPKIS